MTPNTDHTALIFSLVNQARVDNSLPELNWDNRLAAAAARHSLDMACNSFVSHTGSDGSRASNRVGDEGYIFQWVGENIYGGWGTYGDPNNVFTWWMNSQAHRDNILGVYYEDAGVGYYLNPETGRGYFTLVFGVPR